MSSTLVETVSINYEDFNDSFLTCGTCLCMFDGQDHTPKLLPCSHTVCRSCLEHIIEAQGRNPTTFRCPICRDTITIPRGGPSSFPPSFIVNQLLDLMARQRRDIIPKCSDHSQQELMFCETCDTVFCIDCTGGSHNGRGASAHTVIPFSVAIKRMSEILLYKASLCMKNLNNACENVSKEIDRLDISADLCIEAISKTFQDLMNIVDQRRHDVITMVKNIRDDKKQILKEQLDIIELEKTKVQSDCQGLQHQVEVRNITKRISDLNEKLDISSTLAEPRENAYMKFEVRHNSALKDLHNVLNNFGRIKISTTFPALCTAKLEPFGTHLKATVTVTTVDYHGNPRTTGSDPVMVQLRNEQGKLVPTEIKDHDNGLYTITFTPHTAGRHKLDITIFDRPIREGPFHVDVTNHKNPCTKFGHRGSGPNDFIQPINIVLDANQLLYVLDTGNSRIKILDLQGNFLRQIEQHGLEQRGGTGLTLTPNSTLMVVNWRTKCVTELTTDGVVINKFTCSDFEEPVSLTVSREGHVFVADNGMNRVWVFNRQGKLINTLGGKGDKDGQFRLITSMYTTSNNEIIVVDNRIQVFSSAGKFLYRISTGTPIRGQYGGITVDRFGNYLASHQGKSVVQVFNPDRQWLFDIDSYGDKLKRPSGLVTFNEYVYVVDLGNDCVKKYRYM